MQLTRHNLVNVAIAATAAILFGAFVFFASKGDDKNADLAAVAPSSTTRVTRERTTTTTTTSKPRVTTTTLSVPTTFGSTTPTTQRRTTTTRRSGSSNPRPTSPNTTSVAAPSGAVTEHSDNSASFSHGEDGSFSASSTDPPGGSDPFRFVIKTAAGANGVSGDTASVKFTVTLTNNTSRRIDFPGGLKITVTMRTPSGGDLVFTMAASDVTDIKPGETITLTQERGVSGYGSYEAKATCDVNYG